MPVKNKYLFAQEATMQEHMSSFLYLLADIVTQLETYDKEFSNLKPSTINVEIGIRRYFMEINKNANKAVDAELKEIYQLTLRELKALNESLILKKSKKANNDENIDIITAKIRLLSESFIMVELLRTSVNDTEFSSPENKKYANKALQYIVKGFGYMIRFLHNGSKAALTSARICFKKAAGLIAKIVPNPIKRLVKKTYLISRKRSPAHRTHAKHAKMTNPPTRSTRD